MTIGSCDKQDNGLIVGFRQSDNPPTVFDYYIHVGSLEAAYCELQERGVNPTPIAEDKKGDPATTVTDPEGRVLKFIDVETHD